MPPNNRRYNQQNNQGQQAVDEQGGIQPPQPVVQVQQPTRKHGDAIACHNANMSPCSAPTECLRFNSAICLDNLSDDVVKVLCNNDHCTEGEYMHHECFHSWEQTVLTYLKSCGRARSWSEKQRHQNLWTKRGYDLAFKACGCKCAKGHLRKDLDWIPPKIEVPVEAPVETSTKKKKKKGKSNTKPVLAVSTSQHHVHNPNNQQVPVQQAQVNRSEAQQITGARSRNNSICLANSVGSSESPPSSASPTDSSFTGTKKKSKFDFVSDRSRNASGNNCVFLRRSDFSSFNSLPRHKLNSYHIKIEDEGSHGNDDTRCFILSTMAEAKCFRTSCVLCHDQMNIFDRYPLIDGTFFLSPMQHRKDCVKVKVDERIQYLSAVCMGCLESWNLSMHCRFCNTPWDGSSLVLGTMYSYDIFAATPCCYERLKCNGCNQLVASPEHSLQFYSSYSRPASCPRCNLLDCHYIKPLFSYEFRHSNQRSPQWS